MRYEAEGSVRSHLQDGLAGVPPGPFRAAPSFGLHQPAHVVTRGVGPLAYSPVSCAMRRCGQPPTGPLAQALTWREGLTGRTVRPDRAIAASGPHVVGFAACRSGSGRLTLAHLKVQSGCAFARAVSARVSVLLNLSVSSVYVIISLSLTPLSLSLFLFLSFCFLLACARRWKRKTRD